MLIVSINNEIVNEGLKKIIEAEEQITVICSTQFDTSQNYDKDSIYVVGLSKCNETILEFLSTPFQKGVIFVDTKFDRINLNKLDSRHINGIISLESTKAQVLNCLRQVSKGCSYFDNDALTLLRGAVRMHQSELSERESEIMNLLSTGKTLQEISEELFLSLNTVITHKRNILRKTGFNKMTKLIAWWSGNIE